METSMSFGVQCLGRGFLGSSYPKPIARASARLCQHVNIDAKPQPQTLLPKP